MKITSLYIKTFRNLTEVKLEPELGFNILSGSNAHGKTSVIEAINMLASLKSFRGAKTQQVIQDGESESLVVARVVDDSSVTHTLGLQLTSEGKSLKYDGKTVSSNRASHVALKCIVFSPEDVLVGSGSPTARRDLIDRAASLTSPGFSRTYNDYYRALKQRNRLLKNKQPKSAFAAWDEALVHHGANLRLERMRFLASITHLFSTVYWRIAGGKESASIQYREGEGGIDYLKEIFARELKNNSEIERAMSQTMVGPHRDDPVFLVSGKPARDYASQGQLRSLILAFKVSQTLDLEKKLGYRPVLLLDDMTSELDFNRQSYFFQFLIESKGQVFITTTNHQSFLDGGFEMAKYFNVNHGEIAEMK